MGVFIKLEIVLPGRSDAEIVIAIVVEVVVDVQAVRVEIAQIDVVAVRVHGILPVSIFSHRAGITTHLEFYLGVPHL